ncbi:MAG: (2Fe-2S) ferredoxin domain-containing protein [Nitrospirae bacterium]|nr:(2Fe-2S) ferredoxin domain-containing protein [Nitrospirota bacterium]
MPYGVRYNSLMKPYSKHIFICQGNDCLQKGSEEIRDEFRTQLMERKIFNTEVKLNKSGCFDQCQYGINLVIYPEGTWYCNVDKSAVRRIIEKHLIAGEVVSNLLHFQMEPAEKIGKIK